MRIGSLHANCGCGWSHEATVEEARIVRHPWQTEDDMWAAVEQSLNHVLYLMTQHVRETGHSVELGGTLKKSDVKKPMGKEEFGWLNKS